MERSTVLWIVILAVGLALVARPVARGSVRLHDALIAEREWEQAQADPAGEAPGDPCAWLSCGDIDLETLVLAGAEPDRLLRAPCLDEVAGNTVIVAHRDTHFAALRHIRPGHRLILQDRRGVTRIYTVQRTVVLPAAEAEAFIRGSRGRAALILVTCHPFAFLGPAPDRFLVIAELDRSA